MPETVILNPVTQWQEDIQDCMTPDYGFARKRSNTRAAIRPAGGRPWSRETSNAGHTFQLSWLRRSWLCMQRLKYFSEMYEDGYFTVIDYDGGGRHYVGNFTGDLNIVQQGNDLYSVEGVTFQELPCVPMVEYPGDWDNDAVILRAVNDYGDLMLAISGAWIQSPQTTAEGVTQVLSNAGSSGDWATYEYRGYGVRLHMSKGPARGMAQVYLDGLDQGVVDLYAPVDAYGVMVLELGAVMLDFHRLKVVVLGTQNAAASGSSVSWCFIEVMR